MKNSDFLNYRLKHSCPEAVFEWLENNKPASHEIDEDERLYLEKTLLNRKEPLIDLGLSLFGSTREIGYELYKNGCEEIKKAVLSGTTIRWFSFLNKNGILKSLLSNKELNYLEYLLKNENIFDPILIDLYEKNDEFLGLDNDLWLDLILFTSENNRISISWEESSGYTEWSKYEYDSKEVHYNAVFDAAATLFEKVDVSDKAAKTLSALSLKLANIPSYEMDLMEVIKRWDIDPKDNHRDEYGYCRFGLASSCVDSNLFRTFVDSDDVALRKAYYTKFIPTRPDDINDMYDRDGFDFINWAMLNKAIFRNQEILSAFKYCVRNCGNTNLKLSLDRNERFYRDKNPNWFND